MIGKTKVFSDNIKALERFEYEIFKGVEDSLPTIRLLTASIVVAISGGCRLYIAFLLLSIEPDVIVYLAGSLVIYATYTLDRSMECEEDKVNRKELISANKKFAIFVSLIALLTGAFLLAHYNLLFIAFLPLLIGYIYSPGVRIGNYCFKLKGPLGVKNLVVALTWGINIVLITQHWSKDVAALLLILSFFTIKIFIYTIINDFRDIEGDTIAGLKTLPIHWGEKKTRWILQVLHHSLHLFIFIAMSLYLITSQFIILFACWVIGLLYTSFLTRVLKVKRARDILVIGEFILVVCVGIAFNYGYHFLAI